VLHYGYTIKLQQAQHVRNAILNTIHTKLISGYSKLPVYLRALYKANPPIGLNNNQLVTNYQSGTNNSFGQLYIQPGCIEFIFIESLLMILLDATFFLNTYNQFILLAIGRDGNNQNYLIA
jgi:hypothetical protein